MTLTCYQCDRRTTLLSPRSRCAICEHSIAVFNETENDVLRARLAELESGSASDTPTKPKKASVKGL